MVYYIEEKEFDNIYEAKKYLLANPDNINAKIRIVDNITGSVMFCDYMGFFMMSAMAM